MTSPRDQLILPIQKPNTRIRQRFPKLIASDLRTKRISNLAPRIDVRDIEVGRNARSEESFGGNG